VTRPLLVPLALLLIAPSVRAAGPRTCARAVQGKIAWNYDGNTRWQGSNIRDLCAGARNSREPARCFQRVMHGGVDYGGGTRWNWENARDLCKGTRNADGRIKCFTGQITVGTPWKRAIEICARGGGGGETPPGPSPDGDSRCPDRDGDGHQDAACGGDDCDDRDAGRFPGNYERCNDEDEDCDPSTVGSTDEDGDGFVDANCCNPQPDGSTYCARDCNDHNALLTPGSQECSGDRRVDVCGLGTRSCASGQRCVDQPNGSGVCVPIPPPRPRQGQR